MKVTLRSVWAVLMLGLAGAVSAQDLAAFSKKVTEHRLPNGLTFILVERKGAPTVSFHTYVDAGSVDEHVGITGLAHLFEHLAFKGTTTIGTSDYAAEEAIYQKMDALYARKKALARLGDKASAAQMAERDAVNAEWNRLGQDVKQYIVEGEFDKTLEQQGAVGMNAGTQPDSTQYFYSLPSNKVELWCNMESDRFANPVIREFYPERDVVMEERRLRVDSNPVGRAIEQIMGAAFHAHPYGYPTIGYMSDLENVTRREAAAFFAKHYNASNMVIAVVGDIQPKSLIPMLDKYFSRVPGGERPEPVETVEPAQMGMKTIEIEDASQPVIAMAFHKPGINHPDDPVYSALADILGGGRTSRLYKRLVKKDQSGAEVGAIGFIPGQKYPGLFLVYTFPTPGHTLDELEKSVWEELERLKSEPVSEEELDGVKTRVRAGLVANLGSNQGLAAALTNSQALTGDWRNLFRKVDEISRLKPEDLMRVANTCFKRKNCTVGKIVAPAEGN